MQEVPKGKLLIIGGAEDVGDPEKLSEAQEESRNFRNFEVLQELLPPDAKADHRIEVITTASEEPHEMGKKYQKAFERANISNVGIIHIGNREEAKVPATVKRIEKASAVFFSGGDQFRLSTILGCSQVADVINRKYIQEPGFIVGGTSAGAMAMSAIMIYGGDSSKGLLKGTVKISSGLGLIDHCIIDTHFINRGRFGRLAEAVIMNPSCIGLGLGEDTALVIHNGNDAECRGSGMVVVIDCKGLGHSNIAYVEEGTPISAENLTVHLLTKGNGFTLKERKFVPAKKDIELEENIRSH
ncbi:cyanophycinase [Cytophagaceae bacterium YF14B1]|uniref:Cyanophycinase n=1 Tax=Xanthocytophaga flava TaxID=3048013 RepID=A0AAE3QLD3_9BACT|nr:cyanophycinase [Xanthocytophaga flavus]MDJ1469572.1 cyanophycinase [Xanthocytophaga flavus]MDJ1480786.1 cyanophycinase [Xanthocytophaga flavus]